MKLKTEIDTFNLLVWARAELYKQNYSKVEKVLLKAQGILKKEIDKDKATA